MPTKVPPVLIFDLASNALSHSLPAGQPLQQLGAVGLVAGMSSASVTNVRTGQQPCFDRMVVDLNGPVKGYTVGYVPEIIQDPTGYTIPVYGKARLQVVVNAPAYDSNGNLTYKPAAKAELSNVVDNAHSW